MSDLTTQNLPQQNANSQSISICGRIFLADGSGALYWPAQSTLIVSDMALGRALTERSAAASPGSTMTYGAGYLFDDTRTALIRLAEVIDRYDAATVIVLDQSIKSDNAAVSLDLETREILQIMQEDRGWIWINGEHLPTTGSGPATDADADNEQGWGGQQAWGGTMCSEQTISGLTCRYFPRTCRQTHEIAGFLHPAARVSTFGHIVRRPCFVGNGRRLLLPAFGASNGGNNVLDETFRPLFGNDGMKIWLLGRDRPNPIASRKLCPD